MSGAGKFSVRAAIIAAALLLIVSAARADDFQARLQSLIDGFHLDYAFPGATVAIAVGGAPVITAATGVADVEAQTPMTPDSRMLAASVGKSFVAATVLALESGGLLARTDLAGDHLGTRDWFVRVPNHDTMTVGDLLRHTAGLPDHVHLPAFADELTARVAKGADALSPEQAIAFVLDREPLFRPGKGWAYSDTGYLLLGLVIEEVTGRTYYDVVTEQFLSPLGLDATAPSNQRRIAGLAVGYTGPANPFGLPARTMDASGQLAWNPATEWTGGGLVSTSQDLARWGRALFGGSAMPAPYLDRLLDAFPMRQDTPGMRYGAGVAIRADTPRGPVYGHAGWIPGYVSSLRHYADHGITVAFQINTDVGIVDNGTDLVPALEAALADLAIGSGRAATRPERGGRAH
jgi:D-alanyl-D-alanine carboxypeptidase